MNSADNELTAILDTITGTGKFSTTGSCKFFFPEIMVHGEELAFPIPPSQAKHLISVAENAPFGMGEKTVHDDEVRKCWQIDAKHYNTPKSGKWQKYLQSISEEMAEKMGVTGDILIAPYKLLIYEKGGHFLPHTDTEKIPGMFGTLIISLPSKHSGGSLLIRHNGEEVKVDFTSHKYDFQHAALFANCEHEVTEVTDGYRICLAYNLALRNVDAFEYTEDLSIHVDKLVPALEQLKKDGNDPLRAVLLNHQYTEDQFSLETLKNEDATKANALLKAAEIAGFTAHIGLVTLHQSGELEGIDDYYYSRSRYNYDEDQNEIDYEKGTMGEVYDESLTVQIGTKKHRVGTYRIHQSNLLPAIDLTEGEPSEKEAEGPTGNAGCSMDYWYRKAAIVIWPQENNALIMSQYDLIGATSTFRNYKTHHLSKKQAAALGSAILTTVIKKKAPSHCHLPIDELACGIAKLKSEEMLVQTLSYFGHPHLSKLEVSSWKALFNAFKPERFTDYFMSLPSDLVEKHSRAFTHPIAALLSTDRNANILPSLIELIHSHDFHPAASQWTNGKQNAAKDLHRLLACSGYTQDLHTRNVLKQTILHDCSLHYIRTDLSKALLEKTHSKHFSNPNSLYSVVLITVCDTLENEINRAIVAYPNWSRPYQEYDRTIWTRNSVFTKEPHLKTLKTFCLDPDAETYDFKTNKEFRSAIEEHIRDAKLDFDCTTIKKGSPHILRLKKNDKSYHRSLTQRDVDIKLHKKLTQLRLTLTKSHAINDRPPPC